MSFNKLQNSLFCSWQIQKSFGKNSGFVEESLHKTEIIRNAMQKTLSLMQIQEIYDMPLLELIYQSASVHRQHHNPTQLQLSHLISVKTGGCPEDCKYCAQSSRYQTSIKAEPMLEINEVLEQAKEAMKQGASRICLGAAWRGVRNNRQFDRILEMIAEISAMGVEVCATLGLLEADQARRLKRAGLYAYNHNLDTSDSYYGEVITSRKFCDRLQTISYVKNLKLSVCCGGIIGMGESKRDRLRLLQILSSFDPHPESVPINRLEAIPGTPLEKVAKIDVFELVKVVATARILMPQSMIRLAAGRQGMSHAEQALCLLAGANSLFIGEKLLTVDNRQVCDDQRLLALLSLKPSLPKVRNAQE